MDIGNYAKAAALFLQMKLNQWKSQDELESIQEEKLVRLFASAKMHVPFYKKNFEGKNLCSVSDLASLPFCGKADVQSQNELFISKVHEREKLDWIRTSGSTGLPTTIYFDQRDGLYGAALRYHSFSECGFGPKDLLVNLMVGKLQPFAFQSLFYRIKNLSSLEDDAVALKHLNHLKPDMVSAFPSKLSILAHYNQGSERPLKIRSVLSASEHLDPRMRKLISGSFSCDLRNYYGMNESWSIAWECEKGSMHINSDSVLLEIVDEKGDPARGGMRGEIVLTSLWRYSMPFIRYRTGDFGSFGARCRCGRGLHTLKSLEGRENDILFLQSGKPCSSINLITAMKHVDGVVQYQAFQEHAGKLLIIIVPSIGFDRNTLIKALNSSFPEPFDIQVETTERLEREKSGKVKVIHSKAKSEMV